MTISNKSKTTSFYPLSDYALGQLVMWANDPKDFGIITATGKDEYHDTTISIYWIVEAMVELYSGDPVDHACLTQIEPLKVNKKVK